MNKRKSGSRLPPLPYGAALPTGGRKRLFGSSTETHPRQQTTVATRHIYSRRRLPLTTRLNQPTTEPSPQRPTAVPTSENDAEYRAAEALAECLLSLKKRRRIFDAGDVQKPAHQTEDDNTCFPANSPNKKRKLSPMGNSLNNITEPRQKGGQLSYQGQDDHSDSKGNSVFEIRYPNLRPEQWPTKTELPASMNRIKRNATLIWYDNFDDLAAFKAHYGHCNVPAKYFRNLELASWVQAQRRQKKVFDERFLENNMTMSMTPRRVHLLESLGFQWSNHRRGTEPSLEASTELPQSPSPSPSPSQPQPQPQPAEWSKQNQGGNVNDPDSSPKSNNDNDNDDEPLRISEDNQNIRVKHRPTKEELSACRTARSRKAAWSWYDRFHELAAFIAHHGHCEVPQKYPQNQLLANWINKQRQHKNKLDDGSDCTHMTPHRIALLEGIGFRWSKRKGELSWEGSFQQLEEFHRKHGHCNVLTKAGALGRWVSTQRSEYKRFVEGKPTSIMTKERLERLEDLGFSWRLCKRYVDETKSRAVLENPIAYDVIAEKEV